MRVQDEPGYVLHRYDWSESSLILEAFSRRHGRVALVAKGAKRPTSNFRPVLLPLQPLRLSWAGDAEIRNLRGAEWVGGHVMPTGAALLAGCHVNELLLRLLPRDDAHPLLFDAYVQVVGALASQPGDSVDALLRAFEIVLLREVGVLPALDMQTLTLQSVEDTQAYRLLPEGGLMSAPVDRTDGEVVATPVLGHHWRLIEKAANEAPDLAALAAACAPVSAALRPQLRALLHYHCGVPVLRTRQLMMDLQALT